MIGAGVVSGCVAVALSLPHPTPRFSSVRGGGDDRGCPPRLSVALFVRCMMLWCVCKQGSSQRHDFRASCARTRVCMVRAVRAGARVGVHVLCHLATRDRVSRTSSTGKTSSCCSPIPPQDTTRRSFGPVPSLSSALSWALVAPLSAILGNEIVPSDCSSSPVILSFPKKGGIPEITQGISASVRLHRTAKQACCTCRQVRPRADIINPHKESA